MRYAERWPRTPAEEWILCDTLICRAIKYAGEGAANGAAVEQDVIDVSRGW